MLSEAEIQKAIKNGESTFIEFKGVAKNDYRIDVRDLAKAVASLANTRGGHLILGVEKDGTMTGVGTTVQADALMRQVSQGCADRIKPALSCAVERIACADTDVLVVEVPAFNPNRPHFVDGMCYIRDANQSRPASREEIGRILQSAGFNFDEQPVEGATQDELDYSAADAFRAKAYELLPEDVDRTRYLRALKCLDERDQVTVSGILFFGKNPQRWLPDARISVVRFRGVSLSDEFADKKEIDGRLSDQIENAEAFLATHVQEPAEIEGFKRRENGVPEKALREALINAVIHRDYRMASQIRIFIFDDRVEIMSPGDLLNRLTLDSIRIGGISQRRNPIICSLVARLERQEHYGLGISRMIRLMRERGLPEPEFSLHGGHFRVVLRNRSFGSGS